MKKTFAIMAILAFVLSGCGGAAQSIIDPDGYTARTQAEQKTRQEEAFAESQRWLAEGRRAEADGQRAEAEARAAEASAAAQQAQAQAMTAQAEAQAEADKVRSEAMARLGEAIRDAAKPNNAPIIVALLLVTLIAGWAIWNQRRATETVVTSNRAMLSPPPEVKLIADAHGLHPIHDGTRWLLLDVEGHVVKRQRLITG